MIHQGIQSFCNRKQVNTIKTVKLFTKETGLKADVNFAQFATFVDKKIKSGEIKGNSAPLNKELWDEAKREREEWNAEMNSFSKEQKAFYRQFKKGHLDSFFAAKQINRPKQAAAITKLGKMIPVYDKLVELNLLEEFLKYEKDSN